MIPKAETDSAGTDVLVGVACTITVPNCNLNCLEKAILRCTEQCICFLQFCKHSGCIIHLCKGWGLSAADMACCEGMVIGGGHAACLCGLDGLQVLQL